MQLKQGDIIGFASPSRPADPSFFENVRHAFEEMGYGVRFGENLFARGWGFAATPEERAQCLHSLVTDDEVRMILFGGGEGGDDVIPYLDYERIAAHPKLWMSFSDGTSILSAVHTRTGLPVYYGQAPGDAVNMTEYDRANFELHLVKGGPAEHLRVNDWRCLTPGTASGELLAGYLDNFVYLANGGWIVPEPGRDYILCIEEHEQFFGVEHVSDELARLENSPVFKQTKGLLFGQYSEVPNELLLKRMTVLGEKYGIPVAYCEDFGHGPNHAILRVGANAVLDTRKGTLVYPE